MTDSGLATADARGCGGVVVVGGVGADDAWVVGDDAATDVGLTAGDGTTIASALGGCTGWPKAAIFSGT